MKGTAFIAWILGGGISGWFGWKGMLVVLALTAVVWIVGGAISPHDHHFDQAQNDPSLMPGLERRWKSFIYMAIVAYHTKRLAYGAVLGWMIVSFVAGKVI